MSLAIEERSLTLTELAHVTDSRQGGLPWGTMTYAISRMTIARTRTHAHAHANEVARQHADANLRPAMHLAAARAAAKLRDVPEATRHYRAAVSSTDDPQVLAEADRFHRACFADKCILRGRAEEHNQHWAAAAELFRRAFDARHDAASAAHAASDLRRAKLELHEAARLAEFAVSKSPSRADFHLVLGLVYRDAGLVVRARCELERALEIDPQNEHALKFLARSPAA